jgi:hypothetical protein
MRQAASKFAEKNFGNSVKLESNGIGINEEEWPKVHAKVSQDQWLLLDVVKT